MFSKPLACSSTLDRRPWLAAHRGLRPTWRSFGARPSTSFRKILMLKHTLHYQRLFRRRAPKAFLSQAGPRFNSRSCSS